MDAREPCPAVHALVLHGSSDAIDHRCRCGWRADGATSNATARRLFELHIRAAAAERTTQKAREQLRRSEIRIASLRATCEAMQSRRADLHRQRRELHERVWAAAAFGGFDEPVSRRRLTQVITAANIAGWSDTTLWLRGFALGLNLPLDRLQRALDGDITLTRRDYNYLAVALNELFYEEGLGHGLDIVGSRPYLFPITTSPALPGPS